MISLWGRDLILVTEITPNVNLQTSGAQGAVPGSVHRRAALRRSRHRRDPQTGKAPGEPNSSDFASLNSTAPHPKGTLALPLRLCAVPAATGRPGLLEMPFPGELTPAERQEEPRALCLSPRPARGAGEVSGRSLRSLLRHRSAGSRRRRGCSTGLCPQEGSTSRPPPKLIPAGQKPAPDFQSISDLRSPGKPAPVCTEVSKSLGRSEPSPGLMHLEGDPATKGILEAAPKMFQDHTFKWLQRPTALVPDQPLHESRG